MKVELEIEKAVEEVFKQRNYEKIKKEATKLSKRYCTEERKGQNFITNEDTALAYSLIRMPATHQAVKYVLKEWNERTKGRSVKIEKVLDLGAGTGAGMLALKEQFPEAKGLCLEKEKAMQALGKKILSYFEVSEVDWKEYNLQKQPLPEGYDLIMESYLCNEWGEKEAKNLFYQMLEKANQFVICIEPGTKESFQRMLTFRKIGLEKGFFLLAPCAYEGNCPLQEDWCHFSCRTIRGKWGRKLKQGELAYEDEKFTYFIFSKIPYSKAKERILRHPKKEKNVIKISVCTKEGVEEKWITKKEKEIYHSLKKKKWGDEI